MRLRFRLALAFALLALVPLAFVVPLALSNLRATLSQGLESRIRGSEAAARVVLDRTSEACRVAVAELADSIALEEFAQNLRAGSVAQERVSLAGRLMKARGLSVLSIFDQHAITLSSGHLPALLGDPDPALFAVTQKPGGEAVPVLVAMRDESGIRSQPAIVCAHPLEYAGARLWVVGGTLLDAAFAQHLAQLTDAAVEISSKDASAIAAGAPEPPTVERVIDLAPVSQIRMQFSRGAIARAERDLRRAFAALTGVGLLLAVVLGAFVSQRITRPVEALTAAAQQIATGDLDLKVKQQGTAEIGELVNAFNRMTANLRATTAQLVAAERIAAWQEVAKRVAHEIKNPLTPIKMSLETLIAANSAQDSRFPLLFQQSAGAMLEEVERLRRIVDEFSRFARLPKPQLSELDLGQLVNQVLGLYRAQGDAIELRKEILPGLRVNADRDQLTQVLMNLLKNAEEAIQGKGTIEIRVTARDREALVEVRDSGPGIEPEVMVHLFEPYFTTKAGGTGLGLAIASRICQEHRGRLEVASNPGQGAQFTVALELLH